MCRLAPLGVCFLKACRAMDPLHLLQIGIQFRARLRVDAASTDLQRDGLTLILSFAVRPINFLHSTGAHAGMCDSATRQQARLAERARQKIALQLPGSSVFRNRRCLWPPLPEKLWRGGRIAD